MPTVSAKNSSSELEAETLAEAARQNEQLVKEKRAEFTGVSELEAAKRSLDTAQSKLESDKQTLKRRRDTPEREETSAALKEANAKPKRRPSASDQRTDPDEACQSSVAS